jgi:hypothetical protein
MVSTKAATAALNVHIMIGGGAIPRGERRYAGITSDPKRRLAEHNVDTENVVHAAVACESDDVARGAEKILHLLGYEGSPGAGDAKGFWVYGYMITAATKQ